MIPVKEIIGRIRGLSNDKQATGYDDEDILAAINDGVAFVGRMIKSIRPNLITEEKVGTLNRFESNIHLDEPVAGILDVQVNGHRIEATQAHCIHNLLEMGCPHRYYMKSFDTLRLHPIPTEHVSYIVVFVPQVKKLCFDDCTPYPNDFDNIIVEYANARLNMTNEFDMSQEMAVVQALTSQVEEILYQFPDTVHVIEGYWDRIDGCHDDYGHHHHHHHHHGIHGYW